MQSIESAASNRRRLLALGLAVAWPAGAAPVSGNAGELTVAAFPLVDEIIKAALPMWNRRHPQVALKVVSRQYMDHHTAMTTALSTAVRLPDVMALEVSYVGRFKQGGGLEDLSRAPYEAGRFRDRFVPYAYDQAVGANGAVVALPTDIGPGTMLYRKDLVERAGVAEAELTRSWETYVQAGARIKAKTGAFLIAHAQQIKDIVMRTGIQPGQGMYFGADSSVLVREPRFVRAFELAREVRRQKLDAKVGAWSNEWAEGFKRGTLATELSGAWLVGQMSNWVAPSTAGLWRAAQFPEGAYAGYGGTSYALPRRADPARKALAWDFVQMMTLEPELQFAAFKSHDAFPALLQTHNDPFFEGPVDFLGGQKARLLWRDAARRITAVAVHKQNNFADEVISTELDNVLDRGKNIRQALGDAERLLQRRADR